MYLKTCGVKTNQSDECTNHPDFKTAYISTRYKIDNLKQWKDGWIVKFPDADYINKQLKTLWEFEEIFDAMPNI